MALVTLFVWSFLAATILPLGSEPALAAIVRRDAAIAIPVLVATAGNYAGSCTTYWLAHRVTRNSTRIARASERLRRWGTPALLLSWVPIVGDAIVIAAGMARVSFLPFSFFVIAGKAARYVAVAWAVRAAVA